MNDPKTVVLGASPPGASDPVTAARAVREMFTSIAPRYDLLNHLLSFNIDRLWWRRAARAFAEALDRPRSPRSRPLLWHGRHGVGSLSPSREGVSADPRRRLFPRHAAAGQRRSRPRLGCAGSKRTRSICLSPMPASIWFRPLSASATWRTTTPASRKSSACCAPVENAEFWTSANPGA